MKYLVYNFSLNDDVYGKKGENLKKLKTLFDKKKKIIVPDTLSITTSFFNKVIKKEINSNGEFRINDQYVKCILDEIHSIFADSKLVVRSSATCEDSIFFSGSGQYESFLNIYKDVDILKAISQIYDSLYSSNSKIYSELYGIDIKKESMAILIQKVAPVVKAGVMFSCDPVTKDKKYIIEMTHGLGTGVVEGFCNLESFEIDYKKKNEIVDDLANRLIAIIDTIRSEFGFDVDIEWGIDKELNIYIFQTRPIIFSKVQNNYSLEIKKSKKGGIISNGFAIGKISKVIENKHDGLLLITEKFDFANLELLLKSKGVIVSAQSKLSHLSNILRELNIPCLYLKECNYSYDKMYVLDGFDGRFYEFDSLNLNIKTAVLFKYLSYLEKNRDYLNLYNKGILSIQNDDKYEQVVLGIEDTDLIIKELESNNFIKTSLNQKIFTYDFRNNPLYENNVIIRIQASEISVRVQVKQLFTPNEKYRREKGVCIYFDNINHAKDFLKSLNLEQTGYQERLIEKYKFEDVAISIITWPERQSYLGIETKEYDRFEDIGKKLHLEKKVRVGWGGGKIFEYLGLSIKDLVFNDRRIKNEKDCGNN